MSKVRYQKVPTQTGVVLRRTESGEGCGGIETVLHFTNGYEELADEITAMLNALQIRKDFDAKRISSMVSVQVDDLPRRTGDEHGDALAILRWLAQEVGKEVIRWVDYSDHLWALLDPPEPYCVPPLTAVRGVGPIKLERDHYRREALPQGMLPLTEKDLSPVRALYGQAMANLRAYETFREEIQDRIDREFGHLSKKIEIEEESD